MRGALWFGMLLLALLPGCLTRMVWQREHRSHVQWTATSQLSLHEPADAAGPAVIVMQWPGMEEWQRCGRTVYPPTSRAVGLAEDLAAVQLVPVQWPESLARLMGRARSPGVAEHSWADITLAQDDAEVALEFGLYYEGEAALAELRALHGVGMERFCYTCGASAPRFRDRARVAPTTVLPKDGVPVSLVFVRRTPIGVTEKVLVTPFAATADLVLLPFELLSSRVWWGD